jgi:transposase
VRGGVTGAAGLQVQVRYHRQQLTQVIQVARAAGLGQRDGAGLLAALRPRPGDSVSYATPIALRELGRRAEFLDGQLGRLDELIVPLVTARAPGLLALHGVGPDTAALLLIAAGDHPARLRSEAAWAYLCAVAPIPASSGKVTRHRLNPGGNREANHALWRIVITRMSSHAPTRAYVERRSEQGLSKKEIIRRLKRYVAREVYRHPRAAAD